MSPTKLSNHNVFSILEGLPDSNRVVTSFAIILGILFIGCSCIWVIG
jgi:hypothetical protein